METLGPVRKASVSTLLFSLGFPEEEYLREAESDLLRMIAKAGAKPLELPVEATFDQLVAAVGEAPLEEALQRAEALLEVLNMPDGHLKETLMDLLSVDVIDMIAMIADQFGADPQDVYWAFAEIGNKESRARAAVSTFANLILESIRRELA
ncbi:hypothetical protein [Ignicoccus hospitalis]|uniref:Uncharacterized protein n=1 Tax=Ignicoccus hospitalis (strain KIN4/I / DSM 18386 / JCM 14125) TaxID=453591 RepID=A8AAR0_IGNH4|nr:hypothetical protein [Ignicoccus hospitalis]ABU82012.1 hypothetical protein Igni_0830 [Ignicoccus hospitalis KIN4/I]HIH90969.1 hypothetical protein [Desulfurococcaceae archaeon]